ncbi:MAG TPA: proline dehydrogenase family protein [Candidatus Acidoferrales bacterium]|nr:proline dehydrogenase family protein [Candidatus Acidoferrales bacterium]
MGVMRSALLLASQNVWLRERATKYRFVRGAVARFMPGEELSDALGAAQTLENKGLGTILTHLGENVADATEAQSVTDHYLEVLRQIRAQNLRTEISVKPTQLGLDLSADLCFKNLKALIEHERADSILWIDMEASQYLDATLELYRRALALAPNVGICLQAYLRRTKQDFENLLALRPSVRLVKGAYNEPAAIAFPGKVEVDANYFALAQQMLTAGAEGKCRRIACGTHDIELIRQITDFAEERGLAKGEVEIQMLFGIQRAEQERLAAAGYRSGVLVAYGSYWYPWFVRRLAERPANLWFLVRNVFAG